MIIIKAYSEYDRYEGHTIKSSSDFEEAVEKTTERFQRDLDAIQEALSAFKHDFTDLLTAEGEERANLNAELYSCFRKVAEEYLLDEDWTEHQLEITEGELLEALRALSKAERGDLAIKIAAL